MAAKNKLSVYLIKEKYSHSDQAIIKPDSKLLVDLPNVGKVYFSPSKNSVPEWVESFFHGSLGDAPIFNANARSVLISRVLVSEKQERAFAITMGYGKNMLADDVIEEDFGLKVVLNTITPDSLRRINKVNIGGNQKASNEQLPLEAGIDDFGFDIERDLVSTITGRSSDESFTTGIVTGSDLLSLTAEVDITNLCGFLKQIYNHYSSNEYKNNFAWIDHIRRVKSQSTKEELDAEVIRLINENSPQVWMAVPEVINWEDINGFKCKGNEIVQDIDIALVCSGLNNPLTHIEQLKRKRITALRSDNGNTYKSWTAYKCIYAEIDYKKGTYCLNNGSWFRIDSDFCAAINAEYANMPISTMTFLPHSSEYEREEQYTRAFVQSDPDHLFCMDQKSIMHGGGHSRIELCDILTNNGTYIHIKPYSSSSTLSHLFNQAVVSAELVTQDPEFRAKANAKLKEEGANDSFSIQPNCLPDVILAIISKHREARPPIPLFSKIALRYCRRRLQSFGCKVFIKNILKGGKST